MSTPVLNNLDFQNFHRAANLPDPAASGDAATKGWTEALFRSLNWKDNVVVASNANINLSAPGATINGVTMAANDRFLAKDQTTGSQNGLYVWTGAATAAVRASDANTWDSLVMAVVRVNGGTAYRQTAITGTLGTTALVFESDQNAVPSADTSTEGISARATQSEVNNGTVVNKHVTPETLKNATFLIRKHSQLVGDGSALVYNVDHNFNTLSVIIQVFDVATGALVIVDSKVVPANLNRVTITFGQAPASDAYRVVVIG